MRQSKLDKLLARHGGAPTNDADLARRLLQIMATEPKTVEYALASLSMERYRSVASRIYSTLREQRKERQLEFYRPNSEKAMQVHTTDAKRVAIGGGNRSGKTETCIVELAQMTTGVYARSVREALEAVDAERGDPPGTALRRRFRGPCNVRVVCESLTTTLHQVILKKLQWWQWEGVDAPGGDRGHWGWIPRNSLIGGSWDRSWSEKYRRLRVLCRDPLDHTKYLGESTWEFFSHDQDPSDFASGACHAVLSDEATSLAIWKENEARTISVSGKLYLAMTWPDDPAINVDWIFDRLYEPAQVEGSGVEWINLWTTENPNIDQQAVDEQAGHWDDRTREVRLYGRPIRFSNRIHPLFTDADDWWCFHCGDGVLPEAGPDAESGAICSRCKNEGVVRFNHVRDFDVEPWWPVVFLLDPHPRKPHMGLWVAVDPQDDWWVVAEGQWELDPVRLREAVETVEQDLHLDVRRRWIDPNMGRSPSSATHRGLTWQDEFGQAGLTLDLADDSDVGRGRTNERLRPDPATQRPRLVFHPRCPTAIRQFKRYSWDEYRHSIDRDVKQKPKEKEDDYPTLVKYLANAEPEFRGLRDSVGIFRRREVPVRRRRESVVRVGW